MYSTKYVLLFVLSMTTFVALLLTVLYSTWKEKSAENEAIFNKRAIISAVQSKLDSEVKKMNDEEIVDLFNNSVKQMALNYEGQEATDEDIVAAGYAGGLPENIDMAKEEKKHYEDRLYPLFVYDDGQAKNYIVTVRGKGLWDKIWGNIALADDFETVVGATFDHKGETPGLGAEIKDNPSFAQQFEGKKIYNTNGDYVSVMVRKGGAKDMLHEVDGISGATITSDGVTDMLEEWIEYYEPYFERLKMLNAKTGLMHKSVETQAVQPSN